MSTLPRQALNARAAETVERLLEAAAKELAEVGPEALTIRMVAARAGVAPATAYNYFGSKNHLFAELFLRKVLLDHPVQITGRTALDRVRSVTRHLTSVLGDAPHLAAAANHALLGSDPDDYDNPDTWTVLEDPEGNVFCVTSNETLSGWV